MENYDELSNAFDNMPGAPGRLMPIFYLIDTSGSMQGAKIGQVNNAMRDMFQKDLLVVAQDNDDAEIRVAVLTFDDDCHWITGEDEPLMLFDDRNDPNIEWQDLRPNGLTCMGAAFLELYEKLSRESFLKYSYGYFSPVLILMSDGEPNDDWISGLNKLKENGWFQQSIKIAIKIGENAKSEPLEAFTNNPECVLTIKDKEMGKLNKLIVAITVHASKIVSHPKTSIEELTPEERSGEIVRNVINEEDDSDSYGRLPDDFN